MGDDARITGRVEGDVTSTIAAAGMSADYIIIGDTNHSDQGVRNALAGPELMQGLAESGVAHICLEVPSYLQPLADQYRNGELSYEEFQESMQESIFLANEGEVDEESFVRSVANTIAYGSRFGIDVHFVDPGLPIPPQEVTDALVDVMSDYELHTGLEIDYSDAEALRGVLDYMVENELISDENMAILEQHGSGFMDERLNDQNLYNNIIAATNGEKTAIIYGAAHDHLGELLGDNVMVLDIYDEGKNFYKQQDHDGDARPAGEPDFVYILRDGAVYITDHASLEQSQAVTVDEDGAPANGYFLGALPIDPPTSNNTPGMGQ